jgi:hypothetical protein
MKLLTLTALSTIAFAATYLPASEPTLHLGKLPAEREFQHAGVASHPGDQGMQKIANAINQKIDEATKPQ